MVIYDVEKSVFFTSPLLFSKDVFESSPCFSTDGKHILVTITDHGNFPAYNKDADLYMFHLADSTLEKLDVLNGNDVESYHSWSSTGRWVVFSSRRMDGLYMNAYIAHVDEKGNPEKPFLLPQEDASFHKTFLYSCNIPESAIRMINFDRSEFEKVAKGSTGSQVSFESYH